MSTREYDQTILAEYTQMPKRTQRSIARYLSRKERKTLHKLARDRMDSTKPSGSHPPRGLSSWFSVYVSRALKSGDIVDGNMTPNGVEALQKALASVSGASTSVTAPRPGIFFADGGEQELHREL